MKAIFRYELSPVCAISLPKGAVILSVHAQQDDIQMWALVDPKEWELETRCFRVYPTGEPFDSTGLTFLGTALLEDGDLVFHVFECT